MNASRDEGRETYRLKVDFRPEIEAKCGAFVQATCKGSACITIDFVGCKLCWFTG